MNRNMNRNRQYHPNDNNNPGYRLYTYKCVGIIVNATEKTNVRL